MCCGGKTTTPANPQSPFATLLCQTETEIARVLGQQRTIVFEYNPTDPVPSRRWYVYVAMLMPESFYGETGESALRRCFEAFMRKPSKAA